MAETETDAAVVPLTSREIRRLDPKFIYEVALGVEAPEHVAARWGIAKEKWAQIQATDAFRRQVAALQAELERDGTQFGATSGVMAKVLLDKIFQEAVGPETDIKNRLEVLKSLAKYANFEPKNSAETSVGPKFSINISIPEGVKISEILQAEASPTAESSEEAQPEALQVTFGEKKDVLDEE